MLLSSPLLTSQVALMSGTILLQADAFHFQDLSKLLVIGFVVALVAGVGITVVRLRLRDEKPAAAFLSINSDSEKK